MSIRRALRFFERFKHKHSDKEIKHENRLSRHDNGLKFAAAICLKIWYAKVFIGCAIYTSNSVVLVLTKLLNKQWWKQWYNVTYEIKNFREMRMVLKNKQSCVQSVHI